jgi:hypothetical protein
MKHSFIALLASALCLTASAQVKYVSANTTKLNVEQLQDKASSVQVSRYFFAGYNTLCLPMSMSAEQLSEAAPGLTVERLMAIRQDGSVLNLYFADCTDSGIEAGVPYLVYSPKEQSLRFKNTDAMAVDASLKAVRLSDEQGNQVTFSSSWEAIAKEGRYGIPAQQNVYPLESVLVRTEGDKTFLPTRCGFSWDAQSATASELQIKHVAMSEATAIAGVKTEKVSTGETYDLSGRKVSGQMKKGIYVVDGEKVLVK